MKTKLVLPYRNLSVDFFDEINDHRDDDEKRRATDRDGGDASEVFDDYWKDRDDAEEKRADKRQTGQDARDMLGSGITGTNTGNERAVFLEVCGDLVRVKSHSRVEICENENQEEVGDAIEIIVSQEGHDKAGNVRNHDVTVRRQKFKNHLWKKQNGCGENNRNNSGLVDAKWQVGAGATVDLVAADLAGVSDGNWSLGFGDDHHASDDEETDGDEKQVERNLRSGENIQKLAELGRNVGHDTGKDDERDAVADAKLGDELADPHQKHRTGGNDDEIADERRAGECGDGALAFQNFNEAKALHQGQRHSQHASVLRELAAAGFAFFLIHLL